MKKRVRPKKSVKRGSKSTKTKDAGGEGAKSDAPKEKTLLRRTLVAFSPVVIPVGYACVFVPLNNLMAGEPVMESQIIQTLMAMWIAVITIAFLTDPSLFFPSFSSFNIRWSFPVIIVMLMMLSRMLFDMYVSIGPNECILDTAWEFPEEDPLADTGYEEVGRQMVPPGFYFYGLHRLPELKTYTFDDHETGVAFADKLDDDRIVRANYTSAFTLSDGKPRTLDFTARFYAPCPYGIYVDAFEKSVQEAFEEQIEKLRSEMGDMPPEDDFWSTMSSTIFERELTDLLSGVAMDNIKFTFGHYGLSLFSFELETKSTG
jgi:hypothetical protein|eukprot:g5773.t1